MDLGAKRRGEAGGEPPNGALRMVFEANSPDAQPLLEPLGGVEALRGMVET